MASIQHPLAQAEVPQVKLQEQEPEGHEASEPLIDELAPPEQVASFSGGGLGGLRSRAPLLIGTLLLLSALAAAFVGRQQQNPFLRGPSGTEGFQDLYLRRHRYEHHERSHHSHHELFCFCVMRADSEERALLRVQHRLKAGIFDCDDQVVFSDAPVSLGDFEVKVIGSLSSPMGGQMTSSWVNTESFMHAWEYLRSHGSRFARYRWTIKVDPDTVLLPSVLRRQLRAFRMPGAVFLNNCPGVDDGFFGSVEALSQSAAIAYVENIDRCRETLDYRSGWGEDLFAQRCMEQLGVQQVNDFDLVADGNCMSLQGGPRVPECNPGHAAYHPMKAPADWEQCWSRASRGRRGTYSDRGHGRNDYGFERYGNSGDAFDHYEGDGYSDYEGVRQSYSRGGYSDFESAGDRYSNRDPWMSDDVEVEPA